MRASDEFPGSDLIYALPDPYLILSPDLIIVDASHAYLKATFTTREQIIGKHIFEAFPDNPDASDANATKNVRASLEEVLRTRKPHVMALQHYDVPKPGGGFEVKYWQPSHIPVLNSMGEVICIMQKAMDVTNEVRMQRQAERSNELAILSEEKHQELLRVIEAIPQMAWTTLPDGEATYFNEYWYKYTGKTFQQSKSSGWKALVHPDDIDEVIKKWTHSLRNGRSYEQEMRFYRSSDQKYHWHLTRANPIHDKQGRISLWVITATDIDEQKLSNERKDEFISIASHELKTPLTSALAYTQLISRNIEPDGDPALKKYTAKTETYLSRLNQLISGLLDVSRINSGKLQFNIVEFDFSVLVNECIENMQMLSSAHKIIRKDSLKTLVVKADKQRIEQVLINYLSNAVKYSPGNEEIGVSVELQGDCVQVGISDLGIGIAPDKLNKVFNRFYRAEDFSHHFTGLGIGLFIVKEIITRHGGKVWVESRLGKGSTFYFSIPLVASS